jgi:ADP-heptose:LPS heptosyltransferase
MNWYLETKFDLLINFYDEANPIMMMFTQLTKADFKVGFATTDKRLNHLVINTKSKDVSVFMDELIKYLQILKKI